MEVAGVFLLSLARACVNLRVLAGPEWDELLQGTLPGGWYPRELFTDALAATSKRFRDPDPVLERIGAEMMRLWYEEGPGRSLVANGREFLRYQAGSTGYRSLVRGPEDVIGAFVLEHVDDVAGTARVLSSTPFPRALERGVLLGGIQLGGGIDFVEVHNDEDPSRFDVVFR
jgi:hypothetical protein